MALSEIPVGTTTTIDGVTYTNLWPYPVDVEVRFRDRLTGLRLFFDPAQLTSVEIETTAAGGVDTIKIGVTTAFDAIFAPAEGCLVEIVVLSDASPAGRPEPWPRWRGILSTPEANFDQTETRSLLAYGYMEDMQHVLIDGDIVSGGGGDLATMASQALDIYVSQRAWLANVDKALINTGVLRETLTASQSTVRAVMDALAAQSPDLVVWGWRVNAATGQDQFVFAPRTEAVSNAFYAAANVQQYRYPRELSKVANAIRLAGGTSPYPNLIGVSTGNPSFEIAESLGPTGRNLVQDPDFSSRTFFTLYGGSSYKASGGSEGNSYSGGDMVEMDNSGEGLYQDRTGIGTQLSAVGQPMTISIRARAEHGGDTRVGTATFYWLDSSNALIGGGIPDASMALLLGTAGYWPETRFTTPARPSGAMGFRIQIEAGSGSGAIVAGYVSVFDATALLPAGWDLQTFDQSESYFTVIDPRYPDVWPGNTATPHGDGGRHCLRVAGVFTDADNHDAHLQPKGYPLSDCSGNQTVNFVVRAKRTPGSTATTGKMYLEIHQYDSDRNEIGVGNINTVAAGTVVDDWIEINNETLLDSSARYVIAYVTFRGNTDILFDCLQLRDSAAGTEYISGANWERRIFAEDVCAAGSTPYNSYLTYDRRENYVKNQALLQWDDQAQGWATSYLTVSALPLDRATLTLTHEAIQRVDPLDGTLVRVAGFALPYPDAYASRATWTFSSLNLQLALDLGGEKPTMARLIAGAGYYLNQGAISA